MFLGYGAMRRALPLLAVALVVAGCGATYSDRDARNLAPSVAVQANREPDRTRPFANLNAVTELILDPGVVHPASAYVLPGVTIQRYRSDEDAWRATHGPTPLQAAVAVMAEDQVADYVARRGNLVFIGERTAVEAALSRLKKQG
jgi:hypothetical protein